MGSLEVSGTGEKKRLKFEGLEFHSGCRWMWYESGFILDVLITH